MEDDAQFRDDEPKQAPARQVYTRTADDLPPGMNPSKGSATPLSDEEKIGEYKDDSQLSDSAWLIQQAQEMYTYSSDYLDANITNTWERNLSHFHSEHAPGTPYLRKDFKRSSVFRPKTRANVKQQESSLANAMFSTLNLISITPQDETNPMHLLSAAINRALLEYRLRKTIPWFLTVQGAYQDTKVYGLCISHQRWDFREDTDIVPAMDDKGDLIFESDPDSGEKIAMGYDETIVRSDKPCVDMLEPENFRFDPMCDWRDPAGTSPFLVVLFPMYSGEALEMMEMNDSKTGKSAWKKYDLAQLLSTRRQDYDRTRQAREGRERIDPADNQHGNEFTTIWAHMNIMRVDGTDYVYWTMGTELLLTDPVPLREDYPWLKEGERPFTIGYSTVEAHRNYPAGDVEQTSEIQTEINQVANQRLDNVKLVLNKRYYVRRGSQVDLDALVRNVPGGGVMMNDPDKDVVTVNTPDVTGSSYTEQAALGSEFDELAGGFNPATAQQKSVGGMTMAGAGANAVQDYGIKIFVETWVEKTLDQLSRLVGMYETDETILRLIGSKEKLQQKYGVDITQLPDEVFMQELDLMVDIGMGNTDPMRRVERLLFGVSKAVEIPGMAMRVKGPAVTEEIFGALGYRSPDRFFMTDEEFAAYLEENPQGPSEMDIRMRELDIRQEDNQMRDKRERDKAEREYENRDNDRQTKYGMHDENLRSQERRAERSDEIDREKSQRDDQTKRDTAAINAVQKTRDSNAKQTGGTPPK